MSFTSLKQLESAFAMQGCEEILIKPLAQNQDNEKNQIYLGYSNQLFSIFPGKVSFRAPSSSTDKRGSKLGKSIIESAVVVLASKGRCSPTCAKHKNYRLFSISRDEIVRLLKWM